MRYLRSRAVAAIAASGVLVLALGVGLTLAADESVNITEINDQFAFDPADISVTAGSMVTWTNNTDAPHTVTANDDSFDSGSFDTGQTFSQTFSTAGEFAYFCEIHPFMTGTVTVTAAGGTPAATPAATPPKTDTAAAQGGGTASGSWLAALAAAAAFVVLSGAVVFARRRAG